MLKLHTDDSILAQCEWVQEGAFAFEALGLDALKGNRAIQVIKVDPKVLYEANRRLITKSQSLGKAGLYVGSKSERSRKEGAAAVVSTA